MSDPFTKTATISGRVIDNRMIAIETEIAGQFYSRIFDTEDNLIRQGLIAIGWTPPDTTERDAIRLYNDSFGGDVPLTPWRDLNPTQRIVWMQEAAGA